MQKFKIDKDTLFNYLREKGVSTSPYDFLGKLPQFIVLEGELLEVGGTVGKHDCNENCHLAGNYPYMVSCCHKVEKCLNAQRCCNVCIKTPNGNCPCHNKKEQKHEHATGVVCTLDCFNRETSKCTSSHPMKDGKCAVTDGVRTCVCKCSYCRAVPLPEKLTSEPFIDRYEDSADIRKAFNQILTYLASKENK